MIWEVLGRCKIHLPRCIGDRNDLIVVNLADEWWPRPLNKTTERVISYLVGKIYEIITVRPLLAISRSKATHCRVDELSSPLHG